MREGQAFLSPHIGDLENLETLTHLQDTAARYEHLFRITPEVIAHDLHPDYLSTAWALERAAADGIPTVGCQHHHAHVVSCMADNRHPGPVIGMSFDGTGYGTDGTIWGGEVLVATRGGFRRALHLETVPLPGGAAAIRRPGRMAASYLLSLLEPDEAAGALHRTGLDSNEAGIVTHMIRTGLNAPETSSMGRLFDGVAALCGLRTVARYEGEAAILLEMAAHRAPAETGTYPLPTSALKPSVPQSDSAVIPLAPLFRAVLRDLDEGIAIPILARRFHNSVAALTARAAGDLRDVTGINVVALTGGVFQNRLLTRLAAQLLAADGFTVLLHRQVPCNDGGVSLGQAVIALHPTDVEVP